MRIGLVVPGFSANSADWCIPALRHLVRSLAARDDVRVVSVRYPYRAARYSIEGADVIAIGGAIRRGPATLDLWRQALRVLRAEHARRPFDVLHAFWATESGLLATLAGRLLRVPTLVSVAGGELVALPDIAYGDQRLAWERLKVATSLRLASAVSAGSCQLLDTLSHRVPNTKPQHHLPLGVDVDLFRPTPRRWGHRLLHVGALTSVKDQQLLLRAFAGLRRREPRVTLDVVGDGALKPQLQLLARTLHIGDSVCFRGAVDHASLPSAYTAADVFVLSSRHEAQGMVVLEAAACGRSVVGTRVGVVPELEPRGATSVPTRDQAALTDALELAVEAPRVQAALTDALEQALAAPKSGREIVEAEFSLDRCAERFRAVYATLAATAILAATD